MRRYFPALSWFTLFWGFVLVVLHRFATAGLQDTFTREFAMGSAGFALLSSSYFYLYPLLQVPAGFILDLWSPRRVAVFSFLTMTVGGVMFASAASFQQLFAGRVLISVGAAFIWGSLLKIQGVYFSGRVFALLTGFGAVAGSLGVILAGSPFVAAINRLGWRETMYLLAGFSLLLMLGSIYFTSHNKNNSCASGNHPSPPPNPTPKTSSPRKKASLNQAFQVLKNRGSWLLFLCHFGIYGSYAAFIGIWSYPLLVGMGGYSLSQASFFITWVGFSYMLGGPLLGHLSDRLGERRKPVLLISCGSLAIFMAAFLLLPYMGGAQNLLVYPALFMMGFFSPSLILTMVLSRELQDPRVSGVAVGVANSGGFVGAAFAQLVVGFILERGWQGHYVNGIMDYPWPALQQVIIFSTALLLLAFISAYLVQEKKFSSQNGKKAVCIEQ